MFYLNINNKKYENASNCKLYNLGAEELYALDIYIMSENKTSLDWILAPNIDGTPKIQFEIDRISDINGNTLQAGTIIDIKGGLKGESFSNPFVYIRTKDYIQPEGETVSTNDNSYSFMLPSHNTENQARIKMFGGSILSQVGTQWGRARTKAPQTETDEDTFYDERSEWYVNLGTKDDSLKFNLIIPTSTNRPDLFLYIGDIIVIIQPSQHKKLKKFYMYYDTDSELPQAEIIGVPY